MINVYFDHTVREQDKARLAHELEQCILDGEQLIYTELRPQLEQRPEEKTVYHFAPFYGKRGVAEGLSVLRLMMYCRGEDTARCDVYVGLHESIVAKIMELKDGLS
jgi:hypothetical protein